MVWHLFIYAVIILVSGQDACKDLRHHQFVDFRRQGSSGVDDGPARIGLLMNGYAKIFFGNDTLSVPCAWVKATSSNTWDIDKCHLYREVQYEEDGVLFTAWVSSVSSSHAQLFGAPSTIACDKLQLASAGESIVVDVIFTESMGEDAKAVKWNMCELLRPLIGPRSECTLTEKQVDVDNFVVYEFSQLGLTQSQANHAAGVVSDPRFLVTLAQSLLRSGAILQSGEPFKDEILWRVAIGGAADLDVGGSFGLSISTLAAILLFSGCCVAVISTVAVKCLLGRAKRLGTSWNQVRTTVKQKRFTGQTVDLEAGNSSRMPSWFRMPGRHHKPRSKQAAKVKTAPRASVRARVTPQTTPPEGTGEGAGQADKKRRSRPRHGTGNRDAKHTYEQEAPPDGRIPALERKRTFRLESPNSGRLPAIAKNRDAKPSLAAGSPRSANPPAAAMIRDIKPILEVVSPRSARQPAIAKNRDAKPSLEVVSPRSAKPTAMAKKRDIKPSLEVASPRNDRHPVVAMNRSVKHVLEAAAPASSNPHDAGKNGFGRSSLETVSETCANPPDAAMSRDIKATMEPDVVANARSLHVTKSNVQVTIERNFVPGVRDSTHTSGSKDCRGSVTESHRVSVVRDPVSDSANATAKNRYLKS